MKVSLEEHKLGGFVCEGVAKVIQMFNVSRRGKKSAWYKRVLYSLGIYEEKLKGNLIPAIVKDFGGSISVKVVGGEMSQEEVDKVKEFKSMLEGSDEKGYKDELKKRIGEVCEGFPNLNHEEWMNIIDICHEEFKEKIDLYIREKILRSVEELTKEKSKLETTIYNFTKNEIPEEVKNLFKNGVDSVPQIGMNIVDVKNRVNDSLINYLEGFRMRSNYGIKHIAQEEVNAWLDAAIREEVDSNDKEFYENVREGIAGLMAEVGQFYNDNKIDTEQQIKKKLYIEGCVIVLCDKGLGMSMFTLATMRDADKKLMEQMGAQLVEEKEGDVIRIVFERIQEFEKGLGEEQKDYLDFVFKERDITNCRLVLPFLRSTHKIQKMSKEEIKNKDINNLKFRPVIDAKRWATRGYAELGMKMMRKSISELLEKTGPVLKGIKVKNGWRFSKAMEEQTVGEEYTSLVSADIQEAYTNVTSTMINDSIVVVCEKLGYPEWKIKLMKKIITLVLSNNYVETSMGIYLFKEVLPMGYKLSGEALDIVALSGEITTMMNLGDPSKGLIGLPISELKNYPHELVDNDVSHEINMAKGVKDYKRYVDDTHAIIKGSIEEVIDAILAIGFSFPVELTINLDINIWHSEFLDVWSWRGLASSSVSTMMNSNFKVPFGHVKNASGHPEKYKLKSLLGEMLRGRRIGSDDEIVRVTDSCIQEDFISIGYSWRRVQNEMEACKEKIKTDYSEQFVKAVGDDLKRFQYWGGVEYNGNYNFVGILDRFINGVKPNGAPGLGQKPGTKVKSLAYTKRKYLKRQREDMEK